MTVSGGGGGNKSICTREELSEESSRDGIVNEGGQKQFAPAGELYPSSSFLQLSDCAHLKTTQAAGDLWANSSVNKCGELECFNC